MPEIALVDMISHCEQSPVEISNSLKAENTLAKSTDHVASDVSVPGVPYTDVPARLSLVGCQLGPL